MTFEKTAYTEKARKAVELVNKLRDAGAQFQLDLPCVVVCGNQSAGKSSLLERLCGVKLPRAAGTCTKCPTEVRLSTLLPETPGVSWCCQIKLRKEYDKNNKQLDSKPKEEMFKRLQDDQKDMLHYYITAAQQALLNPDTPAYTFVQLADAKSAGSNISSSGSLEATATEAPSSDALAFTRNVIVLEITGADVDLALIDLPGIIQTEQADDGTNVELVQQLVKQYISRQRTIIVATITCKDDIDNQQIVRLAREADKEGLRTIGVLTKADTIEAETHDRWLPVMRNQQYHLKLGYFVVVNPSQEDIKNNIGEDAAAAKERKFFDSDAWFSSQVVADIKHRFGVDAVRSELSRRLVELTQKEVPRMKDAIEATMLQVEEQIQKLPAAPSSDAAQELLSRLLGLSAAVEAAVQARGDMKFQRELDELFWKFRSAVLAARFKVQLTESKKQQKAADNTQYSTASSTGIAGTDTGAESDQVSQQQQQQQQEEDVDFWLDGPASAAAADHEEATSGQKADDDSIGLITLEKVRALAAAFRGRELPGYTPYRVLEVLVEKHKGRWDAAAQHCLQQVSEQLNELSRNLLQKHFGQFAAAQDHVRSLLFELQSELIADTQTRLVELMKMEHDQIWTQNTHYFNDAKQAFNNKLITKLYGTSDQSKAPEGFALPGALSALRAAGYDVNMADLALLTAKKRQRAEGSSESMHTEEGLLDIIAGTLAYFKVSSKRVIDGVPMHIRHFLLAKYCEKVKTMCYDLPIQLATGKLVVSKPGTSEVEEQQLGQGGGGVGSGGALTAELLMSEDRSVAEQRQQLMRQQVQLRDVKKILNSF